MLSCISFFGFCLLLSLNFKFKSIDWCCHLLHNVELFSSRKLMLFYTHAEFLYGLFGFKFNFGFNCLFKELNIACLSSLSVPLPLSVSYLVTLLYVISKLAAKAGVKQKCNKAFENTLKIYKSITASEVHKYLLQGNINAWWTSY